MKKFTHFPNHGDEDGRNCHSISFGDPNDLDNVIVGAEDKERDAKEAVRRLNNILRDALIENERVHIYQIETNMSDTPEPLSKKEIRLYKCEIQAHKDRIKEIKKFFK